MSIATALTNLSARIQNAYTALQAKGATMPMVKNSANLSATIDTIQTSGGGGLQGYTLSVEYYGGGGSSFTIFHQDGTSEEVYGRNEIKIYNNVTYINVYVNSGSVESTIAADYYNILLLKDTYITLLSECLLKGTLVNLWNGTTKPIEEITYDDEILCWDFDSGKLGKAKPFWIKKEQKNAFYWINRFKSGKVIKTTGTVAGHRFFDMEKNKFLYNTDCKGHLCYTLGGPDVLLDCEYVKEECDYYNICTNYHMNLFANGILTGFRYNNLYPIQDMKFVKDDRPLRSRDEFKQIPDSWFYGMRCAEQTDSAEEIASYVMQRELIKK